MSRIPTLELLLVAASAAGYETEVRNGYVYVRTQPEERFRSWNPVRSDQDLNQLLFDFYARAQEPERARLMRAMERGLQRGLRDYRLAVLRVACDAGKVKQEIRELEKVTEALADA